MKRRMTTVAVIQNNEGKYLICKMPMNRGVFPGQWGIPGGGMDENETMEESLRREISEEVGLEISEIKPWYFRDDVRIKKLREGGEEEQYLIYLMFLCTGMGEVKLNDEFEAYKWVSIEEAQGQDLNDATRITFERLRKETGNGTSQSR